MTLGEQDPTVAICIDDSLQQGHQLKQHDDNALDTQSIQQRQQDSESKPAIELNRSSSTDLEKNTSCDTVLDVDTLAPLSNDDGRDFVEQQQDTLTAPKSPHSYSSQDYAVIVIMASSEIDKDTTIKGLQQKGYRVCQQQTLQLTPSQINTLYAYDAQNTKPHYQQLFEGWKHSSISEPVEMVLLEKENAVRSLQALVTEQNSTKKKNRIMDPDSVYVSNSQETVKRDIELLIGTQGSNAIGDDVSSATMNNHDDTVTQTSFETMDGSIEKHISIPSLSDAALPGNITCDTNMDSTNKEHQQPSAMTMETTATASSTLATGTTTSASHLDTDTQPSVTVTETKDTISVASSQSEKEDDASINENKSSPTISPDVDNSNIPSLDQSTETPLDQHDEDISSNDSNDDSTTKSAEKIIQEPRSESTAVLLENDTSNNIPTKTSTDNSSSGNSDKQSAELGSKTEKRSSTNKYAIKKQLTQGALKNSNKKKTATIPEANSPATRKPTAKSDTTKAPPPPLSQSLKSKIRVTTAARTTTALTKHTGTDDSKKTAADETKKKAQRIPRVALLAQQNNKTSANEPEEQQQQAKPKTKAPRGAIARLSAPTAASSRRQQPSSASTGPSTPQVTTTAARGTNVTATLKSEQRKKRQEQSSGATKNETPSSNLKTRLTKSSGDNKTKPMESNILTDKKEGNTDQKAPVTSKGDESMNSTHSTTETNDLPTTSATPATDIPQESEQENKEASPSSSSLPSSSSPLTTDTKEQDDEKEKKTDIHTATETSLQSPAESSTTSSRPETPVQTPVQQQQPQQQPQQKPHPVQYERAVPTTTPPATTTGLVTLDTVNATPVRLIDHHQKQAISTNKVKDLLGRFM